MGQTAAPAATPETTAPEKKKEGGDWWESIKEFFKPFTDWLASVFEGFKGIWNGMTRQKEIQAAAYGAAPATPAAQPAVALSKDKALELLREQHFSKPEEMAQNKVTVTREADGNYIYKDGEGHVARAAESQEVLTAQLQAELRNPPQRTANANARG